MTHDRPPNLTEKLAAVLLTLHVEDEAGNLVPAIDRERAKAMTAKEIVACFECDHYPIRREQGGTNHPTNLCFRLTPAHRDKTHKVDIPAIAKSKRLSAAHTAFVQKLLRKAGQADNDEDKVSHPRSRKMKSRGFAGHRKMGGAIVWRGKR